MSRNIKAFNAALSSIKRNDKAIKANVQAALVECAMFAFEDRNVDPAKRLFAAVSNGINKRAMSHWLSTYAAIHFKDEAPVLSDKRQKELSNTQTADEYLVQTLKQAPAWHEFNQKDNTAQNVWDGADQFAKLREYLAKLTKRATKEGDAGFAELVTGLSAELTKQEGNYKVVEVKA